MINPYDRLEFIIALHELSHLKSYDDDRVRRVFYDTLFEYLYVDSELGKDGDRWTVVSQNLGLKSDNFDIAVEIGHEVTALCREYQTTGWTDGLSVKLKDGAIPQLSDRLWKAMICCELS